MKKADLEIGAEYARTSDGKLSGYYSERVRLVGFTKRKGRFGTGDFSPVVEVAILDSETGEPYDIDFVTREPVTSFYAYRQIACPWPEFVEFRAERGRRRAEEERENDQNRVRAETLVAILEAHGIGGGVTFQSPHYRTATVTSEAMQTICHRLEDPATK